LQWIAASGDYASSSKYLLPMLASAEEQFLYDVLLWFRHEIVALHGWMVLMMMMMMPDTGLMIKAKKMGMEYGGEIGNLCGVE